MGQNPQKPFSQFLTEWHQVSSTDSTTNTQYYQNNLTNQLILIRKHTFSSDELSYQRCKQQHMLRQQLKCPSLQKMLSKYAHDVENQTIVQNLCSINHQFYVIWEHHHTTLADQINKRLKNDRKFTDKQLMSIAGSLIQALEQLQSKGISHKKLTVLTIKLDQNEKVRLCDPQSLSEVTNFQKVFSNHNIDRIYLSPQDCKALQTRNTPAKSSKADVWTLGMILLHLGLLQDQEDCYQEQSRRIILTKVNENLKKFKRTYEQSTNTLISSMLQPKEQNRLNWYQIRSKFFPKTIQQSVIKVNALKPLKKQSPEVLQYLSPQPQPYSFSKTSFQVPSLKLTQNLIHPHPPPNPKTIYKPQLQSQIQQFHPQKQNININQSNVHFSYQVPLKQNKILINNTKPQFRQGPYPIYNPNLHVFPGKVAHLPLKVPQIAQTPHFNRPSQSDLKKFTSMTTSKGYLFGGLPEKDNEIMLQKKTQNYFSSLEKAIENLESKLSDCGSYKNKFHIQNTESITYQSQANHILNKKHRQANQIGIKTTTSYVQPFRSPIIQQPKTHQKKLKQQTISPIQTIKKQFNEPNEKPQYTIENFSVGSRYEGYKLGNMRHGQGKFYYQDGGMYDGQWEYNRMHGKGMLFYQSGALAYDGNWKNDLFEGKGKLYNEQPERLKQNFDYYNFNNIGEFWQYFDGYFVDDMKQGRGKLMLTNGQYFIGNFNKDIIQGKGKFFGKNGVIKGIWENNHLISRD